MFPYCVTELLGNGQQGLPIKLIEITSFKNFLAFIKKQTLAVRFTRLLEMPEFYLSDELKYL